ncbi:hypothetical protein BaRGS_00010451 [Batillaria attramentaria]|uniref:Uncharacterized protein n=1 Tax=Batillaria attramentaria TaxID=370345 RepID=A0ABD0LFC2_9CAEN
MKRQRYSFVYRECPSAWQDWFAESLERSAGPDRSSSNDQLIATFHRSSDLISPGQGLIGSPSPVAHYRCASSYLTGVLVVEHQIEN